MLGMVLTKVRPGRLEYAHQIIKNHQKSQKKTRKITKKSQKTLDAENDPKAILFNLDP